MVRLLYTLAVCLAAGTAWPSTWYVATNGNDSAHNGTNGWSQAFATISNAVARASAMDTVLVSNGTYTLNSAISIGKAITVRSLNGRDVTVVNGNYPASTNRCFALTAAAANAVLAGFTITNGMVRDTYGSGAGVNIAAGTVQDCIIAGNQVNFGGGGVGMTGGTVRDCIIAGNRTTNSAAAYGGGVIMGNGVLSNCTISGNTCRVNGGGIFFSRSLISQTCMVHNCTIISNSTIGNGGGGIAEGSYAPAVPGRTIVANCLIAENTSGGNYGGGASLSFGTVLQTCLIAGNMTVNTSGGGGGAYVSGACSILNCTIVSNTCPGGGNGGGLYFSAPSSSNTVLQNTIVYYNTATGNGGVFSNYYAAGAINCSNCCTLPALGVSCVSTNPHFVNLAGGDYRLQKTSRCINAGINQEWMAGTMDRDGHGRIDRFSGLVDIGAYEFIPRGMLFNTF